MMSGLLAATAAVTGAALAPWSAGGATVEQAGDRAKQQKTILISRALGGGLPNGPSTHPVISNDKRYARVIAYQSTASNLVPRDTNGVSDVFAVRRAGPIDNKGRPWRGRSPILMSRTATGAPANGPSWAPAVDGAFRQRPRCVAFLSAASNIVRNDTNGRVDAFVTRLSGGRPRRISVPGRRQSRHHTTQVAVSGDCSRVAFVNLGRLYVWRGGRVKRLRTRGTAADPSFSTGLRNDLVFGARGGIYLSKGAWRRPRRVARGGRNPAYNDIKRRVVTYERRRGGRVQIAYRDLGKRERIISDRRGTLGNGDSFAPVIGNSGYYVTFQSTASNLGVNATRRTGDHNGTTDVYLYTNVRDITLVQSVREKAVPLPGGGDNASMSFYANYIVFDTPAPLGSTSGRRQVYMRYLG